ncbi:hypothetical protein BD410DRAFT_443362 [Rickenella mellea]|uniref:F-box domain-containing protein n=1 Tax=Rickenella mellea TaxID=50990 RepID=A0A4Y7PV21_9AGAM|nr:hypothetical protein BD410DRAFT_443362 [Rickenella mellea]
MFRDAFEIFHSEHHGYGRGFLLVMGLLAQIHAFLSRSADFDIHEEIKDSPTISESSLRVLAPHSDRWSHLTRYGGFTGTIYQELGLFDLPRLRYLSYLFPPDLYTFNVPMLSHIKVEDVMWPHSPPFQSQLTRVNLLLRRLNSYDVSGFASFCQMTSLRDLSLDFVDCKHLERSFAVTKLPEPHSHPIESLSITIRWSTPREFVAEIYDELGYLMTTTVDIFLQMDPPVRDAHMFVFGSQVGLFPYSSTISLHTLLPCDVWYVLENIVRHCAIVHSVQFEVPTFNNLEDCPDFQNLGSLQCLHFRECDTLSQKMVETMAKNISLRKLEITRCKMISEEFLLNLSDEIGEKMKWTV